jgi:ABC-type antimicrobial peptide transport system permease subunit
MIPIRFFRRWGRNLLTISALAISFAMVLSLVSVSYGLREISKNRLEDSPRDLIVSSIGLEPTIENSHETSYLLSDDRYNFSGIMPLLTVIGKLAIPPKDISERFTPEDPEKPDINSLIKVEIGMVGLIPELAEDLIDDDQLIIRSERIGIDGWFDQKSDPYFVSNSSWTYEILLDESIMSEFDLNEGDVVYYVGQDGKPAGSFEIKGKLKTSIIGSGLAGELVAGMGMVHLSELQKISGNDERKTPSGNITDLTNAIYIDLDDNRKDSASQRDIMIYLEELFPGLKVTTKESRLYRLEEEVLVLQVFSYGVGFTTLMIGSLFLSTIMILDVEDRRIEIAVMRAIGISRRTIYLQLLKDSLMLSILGALIGLIPSYLGSIFFDNWLREIYGIDIRFSVLTPGQVIVTGIILLLSVSLFSILPGIRSTMIDIRKGLAFHNNR